jgi:hypothetical protein
MSERWYSIKISPENIKNDIFPAPYTGDSYDEKYSYEVCCDIFTSAVTKYYTGDTYYYKPLSEVLSGGTDGSSLLTGLTIPIFLTETVTDLGYYSVFDGAVLQKDVMLNFLFSAITTDPYKLYFYNTSDKEFLAYLQFSTYQVDWGDGSVETITSSSPNYYKHIYSQDGVYTITLSGTSPWGTNIITKEVTIPYSDITITNPNGIAYFVPAGGNWSATPIQYDYIFSGDSSCDVYDTNPYGTSPFTITGYTKSTINDLIVYGNKSTLVDGKYKVGVDVPITKEVNGTYWGASADGLYTAYTINNIDYYDYSNGTTVFVVQSSGLTSNDLVCSAITKDEVLLNVIDEAEIRSDVSIDRGKLSAFERLQRLNEVDSIGALENYGYGFFNVVKI